MRMSLWAQYHKERHGWETIEREGSFVAYSIQKPFIRIEELFVSPFQRGSKISFALADEVAQIGMEHGCSQLYAHVPIGANGATKSMKAILAYGFEAVKADNNSVYFLKALEKEGE